VGREGRKRLGMGEEGKKKKRRALGRGRKDMYSGFKNFFLGFCFCFHCFAATQRFIICFLSFQGRVGRLG